MSEEITSAAEAIRRAAALVGKIGWPIMSPMMALNAMEKKMRPGPQVQLMWQICVREAVNRRKVYSGLHPVIEIHVHESQTKEGIMEYMLDCADLAEVHPLNGVQG